MDPILDAVPAERSWMSQFLSWGSSVEQGAYHHAQNFSFPRTRRQEFKQPGKPATPDHGVVVGPSKAFFFYFIIDLTAQSVPVNLLVLSILDRRAYFAVDVSALWVVVV